MSNSSIKSTLVKFVVTLSATGFSIFACFGAAMDPSIRAVLIVFTVVLLIPSSLLLGLDTSRLIRLEVDQPKPMQILGAVLGLPRLLFITVLGLFAIIYPFYGVPEMLSDMSHGDSPIFPIGGLILAAAIFVRGTSLFSQHGRSTSRDERSGP